MCALLLGTVGLLDRFFPPPMDRYREHSTMVVDASGEVLRAFTTSDGSPLSFRIQWARYEADASTLARSMPALPARNAAPISATSSSRL